MSTANSLVVSDSGRVVVDTLESQGAPPLFSSTPAGTVWPGPGPEISPHSRCSQWRPSPSRLDDESPGVEHSELVVHQTTGRVEDPDTHPSIAESLNLRLSDIIIVLLGDKTNLRPSPPTSDHPHPLLCTHLRRRVGRLSIWMHNLILTVPILDRLSHHHLLPDSQSLQSIAESLNLRPSDIIIVSIVWGRVCKKNLPN